MKLALLEYIIDHVYHFECMPLEFEYNDTVYDFDQYCDYLSSIELSMFFKACGL